jgi:hypothetical protein
MASTLTQGEEAQLAQTIEMFEVITESQPLDYQSLEILKEAYSKLGRDKDVVKTSKRIAEAYVDMGQLSSAILEYETILQRSPDDPDVQKALKQIESKASNFSEQAAATAEPEPVQPPPSETETKTETKKSKKTAEKSSSSPSVEDGMQMMRKVFVDSRIISAGDFDMCWTNSETEQPGGIIEPFIQIMSDKGVLPIEKALKVLSDKSKLAYMPLEKYDVDIELTRTFPGNVCRRWSVLPFDRMSKSILVATANPFNQQAMKEIAAATPQRLLWYLTMPGELLKNIRKAFR